MKTIWKYELDFKKECYPMPKGAEILTIQMQGDKMQMWAKVDSEAEHELRYFEIFGTGHPLPQEKGFSLHYIGTVQDGGLVWHLFEFIKG